MYDHEIFENLGEPHALNMYEQIELTNENTDLKRDHKCQHVVIEFICHAPFGFLICNPHMRSHIKSAKGKS